MWDSATGTSNAAGGTAGRLPGLCNFMQFLFKTYTVYIFKNHLELQIILSNACQSLRA